MLNKPKYYTNCLNTRCNVCNACKSWRLRHFNDHFLLWCILLYFFFLPIKNASMNFSWAKLSFGFVVFFSLNLAFHKSLTKISVIKCMWFCLPALCDCKNVCPRQNPMRNRISGNHGQNWISHSLTPKLRRIRASKRMSRRLTQQYWN